MKMLNIFYISHNGGVHMKKKAIAVLLVLMISFLFVVW